MKIHVLLAVTILSLALAACSPASASTPQDGGYPSPDNATPAGGSATEGAYPPPAASADPLNGTGWTLTSLNDQPALSETTVTLNFQDGLASGSDGCNSYSSSYQASDGKLTIDKNIISTMMACKETIMTQSSAYTAMLIQAASYQVDGETLSLLDAGGKTLAVFAQQSRDLSGTTWNVTGISDGKQGILSVLEGTTLTVAFNADGTLNGSAGCNSYGTTYEVDGTSLKIGEVTATLMACTEPQGVMEQEQQFLKALPGAVSFSLDGDRLSLRAADGSNVVTLTRAEAPAK